MVGGVVCVCVRMCVCVRVWEGGLAGGTDRIDDGSLHTKHKHGSVFAYKRLG